MKLIRLRLRHFRGVAEREITLATRGITLIEGPNEIGKSSLAEALDVLLQYPDSSKAQAVVALQPAGRDVGPEIEAEIESGSYRFTYFKRFLRSPQTSLRLTAPKTEQLTGRAAHDRVATIIDETLDRALWDALRIQQGAGSEPAAYGQAPSLARALESAAGPAGDADADDDTLFARIVAERARYWTPTGLPNKTRRNLDSALERARAELAKCEEELTSMQAAVARSAALVDERRQALERRAKHSASIEKLEAELGELEKREEDVKRIELETRNARLTEGVESNAKRARAELIESVDGARAHQRKLEQRAERNKPALREARAALEAAVEAVAASKTRREQATLRLEVAERDFRYMHSMLEGEQMTERRDRVVAARRRIEKAQAILESNQVDDALVRTLESRQLELTGAQARLDAGSPMVRLRAHRDLPATADGREIDLPSGHEFETTVAEKLSVSVPGQFDLEVCAGAGVDELRTRRDALETALAEALKAAGATDIEEAKRRRDDRAEALRVVADSERRIAQDLRDLTLEELEAKIERLSRWAAYPDERPEGIALPKTFEEAKEAKQSAREEDAAARETRDTAADAHASAVDHAAKASTEAQEVDFQLKHVARETAGIVAKLAKARLVRSDDDVAARWERADAAARTAEQRLEECRAALTARSPEAVRQGLEHTRAETIAANTAVRQSEDEARDIAARLEVLGERGLFDAAENARGEVERLTREHTSLERRAEAAALLHDTMLDHRERARASYAAPLRDTIQSLGRAVFGDDFAVELSDDLTIARRTSKGATLDRDQLSAGAREQLAVLERVACALLVNEADGIPLVFDDILGFTDPIRAEAMASVLRAVADRCQLIVLTCSPARFASLDAARRIRLTADGAVEIVEQSEAPKKPAANRLAVADKPPRKRRAKKPTNGDADLPLFRTTSDEAAS